MSFFDYHFAKFMLLVFKYLDAIAHTSCYLKVNTIKLVSFGLLVLGLSETSQFMFKIKMVKYNFM